MHRTRTCFVRRSLNYSKPLCRVANRFGMSLLIFVGVFLVPKSSNAQSNDLHGIAGFSVHGEVIDLLNPESGLTGYAKRALTNAIEIKLQKNGLKLLEKQKRSTKLNFLVSILSRSGQTSAPVLIKVWVSEPSTIERTGKKTMAETWNRTFCGVVNLSRLDDALRIKVDELTDELVNEWLKANQ